MDRVVKIDLVRLVAISARRSKRIQGLSAEVVDLPPRTPNVLKPPLITTDTAYEDATRLPPSRNQDENYLQQDPGSHQGHLSGPHWTSPSPEQTTGPQQPRTSHQSHGQSQQSQMIHHEPQNQIQLEEAQLQNRAQVQGQRQQQGQYPWLQPQTQQFQPQGQVQGQVFQGQQLQQSQYPLPQSGQIYPQPQYSSHNPPSPPIPPPFTENGMDNANMGYTAYTDVQLSTRPPPPRLAEKNEGDIPPALSQDCVRDPDRDTGELVEKVAVGLRKIGAGYQLIVKSWGKNPNYPDICIWEALRGAAHKGYLLNYLASDSPFLVTQDAKITAGFDFGYINIIGVIHPTLQKRQESFNNAGNVKHWDQRLIVAEWEKYDFKPHLFTYSSLEKQHGFQLSCLVESFQQKSGQWRPPLLNPKASIATTIGRYPNQMPNLQGPPSFILRAQLQCQQHLIPQNQQ